jgi:hypothetical protein
VTALKFGSHLSLGGLIARLEQEDPAQVLPIGFAEPHSYRGYYEQLAFEPRRNIRVGDVLSAARSALGATYEGYKGGDYTMDEHTDCWISNYGEDSDNKIGPLLLELLLAQRPDGGEGPAGQAVTS